MTDDPQPPIERDPVSMTKYPLLAQHLRKRYHKCPVLIPAEDALDFERAETSMRACTDCTGLEACRQRSSRGLVQTISVMERGGRTVYFRAARECQYLLQSKALAKAPTTPAKGGGASREFTLASFKEDQGNREALAFVRDYLAHAKDRVRDGASVVLFGAPGVGKTHLATALTWELLRAGVPVAYITFPQYLESLRSRYSTDDPGCVLEIATVPVLVVDDLTIENVTPWVRDLLGTLLDARIQPRKLATVITLNHTPTEIEARYNERIASRMGKLYYRWIPVIGPDRRRS